MSLEETKKEVKIDNSAYMDRFRFLLTANEDIICERYFKINFFNYNSFASEEMKRTVESIVELIQNDLTSKSRIYTWYTTIGPVKINGFLPEGKGFRNKDSEYIVYPEGDNVDLDETEVDEVVSPYDVTFKFELQMAQNVTSDGEGKPVFSNYKKMYEAIWDGTVYPKDVRHRVDLTNSMSQYKGRDFNSMNFIQTLNYRMNIGRQDLVYDIIKKICETASGDGKVYTNSVLYGTSTIIDPNKATMPNLKKISGKHYSVYERDKKNSITGVVLCDVYRDPAGQLWCENPDGTYRMVVEYSYEPYAQYVKSWERAVRKKTDEYRRSIGYYNNNKN